MVIKDSLNTIVSFTICQNWVIVSKIHHTRLFKLHVFWQAILLECHMLASFRVYYPVRPTKFMRCINRYCLFRKLITKILFLSTTSSTLNFSAFTGSTSQITLPISLWVVSRKMSFLMTVVTFSMKYSPFILICAFTGLMQFSRLAEFPCRAENAFSEFLALLLWSALSNSMFFTFSYDRSASPTASRAVYIKGLQSSGKLASRVIPNSLSSIFSPISFNWSWKDLKWLILSNISFPLLKQQE